MQNINEFIELLNEKNKEIDELKQKKYSAIK